MKEKAKVRFETWELRKRGARHPKTTYNIHIAMNHVRWSRTRIRVRTFYDLALRCRVVQFIAGQGYDAS